MKRYTFRAMWLAVLFVIVCSVQAAGAEPFRPAWQTGDGWLIKAVYRSHPDKDKWSEPVYWQYEIVGLEGNGAESYYILEIRDRDDRLNLTARFMYRQEDISPLRMEIIKLRRGKEIVRVSTFLKGAPVQTEQSPAPYDMPVFPVIIPSCVEFSVTKRVDLGLIKTGLVRQEVRQVSGTNEIPGRPEKRNLLEIKCTAGDGTLVFVQYWDKNLPWPVFGHNKNMKYWLVEN